VTDDRTNALLDAVDALTKPIRSKVIQDGPIGSGLAGQKTVTIEQAPLLTQLEDAIRATIGKGGSGSLANERNMLNVEALHKATIIRSQIREWAQAVNIEARPPDKTGDILRRWYAAYTLRPTTLDAERFYVRQMETWSGQIEAMFDPPRIHDLPNPCPVCGASEWVNDTDGLRYNRPLIIQFKPDGPDLIQQATGMCRACLKVWSVRELAYAIETNEEETA